MLIRAYGSYWNPDIVSWGTVGAGNRGRLPGVVRIADKKVTVDFWNAVALYVLHDQFRSVYVGKAVGTRLGPRVRDHLSDRFAGRWDMFSWFTLSTVNTSQPGLRDPGTRSLNPSTIIDTLEAVLIATADPPLNRRHESIPAAVAAEQVGGKPKAVRTYLEEILNHVKGFPDSD